MEDGGLEKEFFTRREFNFYLERKACEMIDRWRSMRQMMMDERQYWRKKRKFVELGREYVPEFRCSGKDVSVE